YLLRILLSQHIQKKKLLGNSSLSHQNRTVEFRIVLGKVEYPFGSKNVLGILVQISLADRYEFFDEENLQRAVHRLLPNLHMVKGTLYKFYGNNNKIRTCYAEFEKTGNQSFTLAEISLLKKSLGEELIEKTERLVPSVFKIRNQEEVLRSILTLSQEIDRPSDLSQVMISFETQSSDEVIFTAICVRAEDQFSVSLENLVQNEPSSCRWILERKQIVRYLENHQPIVAYLFRVLLIPDFSTLRSDGSLNFFAARQKIAASLKISIGDYRDFNGGILIKQEETLLTLRNAFPLISSEQIENIYYSITPIEMQAILPSSTLKAIIDLTAQTALLGLADAHDYHLVSSSKPPYHMVLLSIPPGPLHEKAKDHLQLVEFPEDIQASFSLATKKSHLYGFLIPLENKKFTDRFTESLGNLLHFWSNEVKKLKILRLGLNIPIRSLDPRIGSDATSSIFLKMLFEGLMRIGPDGKLENAVAEKVEISDDRQTYLFHLRPSFWSNGDPLTSHDFEYAWKTILSPHFKSPFNHVLFCIKNAEKAKKGIVPMEEVGIYSINDHLLKVELSSVFTHFLELLALPIFSPVHRSHDHNNPNWPLEEGRRYICNGAFKIEKNLKDSGLVLICNPLYWEKEAVHLDRIVVTPNYLSQNQEVFLQNHLHWVGHPFGHGTSIFKPGPQDTVITYPDNGLYWAMCQTSHPLLKNKKIRQALSFATDRQTLLDSLHYKNDPAFSPLPLIHSQIKTDRYPFSPELARKLWKEGLEELHLSDDNLPVLEILFSIHILLGKQTAEFLCSSWKKHLGVVCRIQGCDFKTLLNRFAEKDFHIGLTRWIPWVNDPFYTLNAFIGRESICSIDNDFGIRLGELIKAAQLEKDDLKRYASIKQIEEILVDEQPIIPLFHTYSQSMKKKSLKFQPNHVLMDFKWARLESDLT
ncbi:MAG: peptide ABC transporter substrate-binding protein, partial [Rhabdochlamydiaceae bacterium]|nr:peptide ABC transporter substrate-binding protein [Rhabdochlamydiaceae bacterium]